MKKILFVFAALLTLAFCFTGCKETKKAEVEISVVDNDGAPVAERVVLYTDEVSVALDVLIPDPTDPLKDEEDWDNEAKYVVTNAQGYVILRDAIVGIEYAFYTYDEGSRQWLTKNLKIKEGKNEVKFVVNK